MVADPMIIEPQVRRLARPRGFSVAKRPGEKNEDAWQYSHKGAAAVSDGASVSFDSAAWSRILVRRFAQRPDFTATWLTRAIAAYARLHDRDELPWMQQAAYDRGSFASLVGIRELGDGRVAVLAVGDSIAVLCDGDRVIATFPYDRPEQFEARPQLLCTNPAENSFLGEPDATAALTREWDLAVLDKPALLCVTDALGHWILVQRDEEPSPVWLLRNIKTRKAFARLVERERDAGRLRRDDTTMLAFWDWSED